MTYSPNLGRWLEVDPIGFDGGDVNLYRAEGNDPTNAVDPSGLQEMKEIETIRGTESKLEKGTFKFKDRTGMVKVLIDVTVKNRRGVRDERLIQIQFTADKDIPANTHWLQFGYRKTLDKDGKEVQGIFPQKRGGRKIWIKKGERNRFVDCMSLPDAGIPAYFDATPGVSRRRARELTIFDKPGFDPTTRMFSEQTFVFDTFLVIEGKVYYHLQWKQVAILKDGKWVAKYTDIKGEPVNRLPDWARQDKLPGGFFPDENDDPGRPIEYPNPIPKENR